MGKHSETRASRPASGQLVVGLDSSAAGRAALRWAADYARANQLRVHAVHALTATNGNAVILARGLGAVPSFTSDRMIEEYRIEIRKLFEAVNPAPDWTLVFRQGSPSRILVEESETADLLVIGGQVHRGMDRAILGSVSHFCLSHAHCPVLAFPQRVAERNSAAVPASVDAGGS